MTYRKRVNKGLVRELVRIKRKKRLCHFSQIKNSANLSTPKKSIYIGYDPEKNLDIN